MFPVAAPQTISAVYYELDEDRNHNSLFKEERINWPKGGWSGYLIEVDSAHIMHFHYYSFKFSRDLPKTLVIDQHMHYQMFILDFLDCR